jgi:hypothetical protein
VQLDSIIDAMCHVSLPPWPILEALCGIGTQASAAASATADQPVIELDHTDGSTSKEESDGESNDESSSGSSSSSTSSDENSQAHQPAGRG